MPNSSLENKSFKIPSKVRNRINRQLNRINSDDNQAKGLKRAKDIANGETISYAQIKRLKNYFDTYSGDGQDDEFNLIGGSVTKKWVNDELGQNRESIKKVKKANMDGGLENQFIKPHTKDNDNTNVTKADGGMIDIRKSSSMRSIMANSAVYNEEIKTIKYLIEYITK